MYHYIAIVDDTSGSTDSTRRAPAGLIQKLAMEPRHRVGCLTLFTASETPTLALPGGGVLLGDLYTRDGHQVTDLLLPRSLTTQQATLHHLLNHYWGDYLLLLPPEDGSMHGTSIVRDPSGGLACAYSLSKGFITSDVSIASHLGLYKERVDWEFIRHCLIFPHMKISRTGLTDVNELLPGCRLSIDGKQSTTTMAWSPWSFVAPSERQRDPIAAARLTREAITPVIRAMAEADQSLLLELSGGLDSSIVGTCLTDARARVACCTAITPLPGADERRYASQVAGRLGIELMERTLDFTEADIGFALPQHSLRPAVWVLGHAVARVMDDAADEQNVRSHFSGSGGDTVFGYLKSAAPAADAIRELGWAAGSQTIIDLSRLHGCTVVKAARLALRKLYLRSKPAYKPDCSLLTWTGTTPLELHPWFDAPDTALPGDRERIFDLAGNQMFVDATLRARSRRVRMPLLSQPVMEACLRVPSWMWIKGGHNRAIARSAFASQLSSEVLNRRSKGSFLNYTFGIYNRSKEAIREFLLGGQLQSHGLLDTREVESFLDSRLAVRDRSFMRIFDLCMIENWVRNHS